MTLKLPEWFSVKWALDCQSEGSGCDPQVIIFSVWQKLSHIYVSSMEGASYLQQTDFYCLLHHRTRLLQLVNFV